MDDSEDRAKAARAHELGMSLDTLSIDELTDRIGALEVEILRLRQSIIDKDASRSAADAVFKS